jgi:hypothetical protein
MTNEDLGDIFSFHDEDARESEAKCLGVRPIV